MKRKILSLLLCALLLAGIAAAAAQDRSGYIDVLSLGKVTASSATGERAFDGKIDSTWSPEGNAHGDYLQVYFENGVSINKAVIFESKNYKLNDYLTEKYKLEYSDDGETWKVLAQGKTIGNRLELNFERVSTKNIRFCIKYNRFSAKAAIAEIMLFDDPKIQHERAAATYYVSPQGSDENDGSIEKPLRTIQAAADRMNPGDTCFIREGRYCENVTLTNFIGDKETAFKAYNGEKVVITGAAPLETKWQPYKDNIYVADVDKSITQLFVDDRSMNIARWPNTDIDRLLDRATCGRMTTGGYTFFTCDSVPENINWDGVRAQMWPGSQWYGYTKELTYDSGEKKFIFKEPFAAGENGFDAYDYLKPKANSPFYLFGILDLLDCGGEWYCDKENNKLYLYTPQGDSPENHTVEYKTHNYGFSLYDAKNIRIEGIDFFGCAVDFEGTEDCTIENCGFKYISSEKDICVRFIGNNNSFVKSSIEYAVGNGIMLRGEGNKVENSIIHDVCTFGDYYAAVDAKGSKNSICRNDLYNSGRFLIMHYDCGRSRFEYNKLHGSGKLTSDLGATYEWGTDGRGTVIAYNWVYDCSGNGIYLDNFSENYVVHHNVIHDVTNRGIMLNSDSLNNKVYHNTIFNLGEGKESFYSFAYSGYQLTNRDSEIRNNIYNGKVTLATGSAAPAMSNNVVAAAFDERFFPISTDDIKDAAVPVAGINDYYTGDAPDVGAYEIGGEYWIPGPDWSIEQ